MILAIAKINYDGKNFSCQFCTNTYLNSKLKFRECSLLNNELLIGPSLQDKTAIATQTVDIVRKLHCIDSLLLTPTAVRFDF